MSSFLQSTIKQPTPSLFSAILQMILTQSGQFGAKNFQGFFQKFQAIKRRGLVFDLSTRKLPTTTTTTCKHFLGINDDKRATGRSLLLQGALKKTFKATIHTFGLVCNQEQPAATQHTHHEKTFSKPTHNNTVVIIKHKTPQVEKLHLWKHKVHFWGFGN